MKTKNESLSPATDTQIAQAVLARPDKPIRTLRCTCCSESFRGRQFHNQDTGFGMGPCCAARVLAHKPFGHEAMSLAEFEHTYGLRGYHFDVVEGPAEAPALDVARAVIAHMEQPTNHLPPDPDGQNNDRAKWAQVAIDAFQAETGTDECDALGDLLADLMHLSDRTGTSFDFMLNRARGHYQTETEPEGRTMYRTTKENGTRAPVPAPAPTGLTFDARETATILSALRMFQEKFEGRNADHIRAFTPGGHFEPDIEPLGTDDIDTLCEKINCPSSPVPPRKVLIQVEDGVAEVLECPDDVDVTIDDKDGQEDLAGLEEPIDGKAVWEKDHPPLSAEVIAARAGILPHDPQDDEPEEESPAGQTINLLTPCLKA